MHIDNNKLQDIYLIKLLFIPWKVIRFHILTDLWERKSPTIKRNY